MENWEDRLREFTDQYSVWAGFFVAWAIGILLLVIWDKTGFISKKTALLALAIAGGYFVESVSSYVLSPLLGEYYSTPSEDVSDSRLQAVRTIFMVFATISIFNLSQPFGEFSIGTIAFIGLAVAVYVVYWDDSRFLKFVGGVMIIAALLMPILVAIQRLPPESLLLGLYISIISYIFLFAYHWRTSE